jgi:hypothetical protein
MLLTNAMQGDEYLGQPPCRHGAGFVVYGPFDFSTHRIAPDSITPSTLNGRQAKKVTNIFSAAGGRSTRRLKAGPAAPSGEAFPSRGAFSVKGYA